MNRQNLNPADRSQRSVFVGNISYEVSEDQLKSVFGQVGPVVHLRLVHDRETGKPKGYGFCEYGDIQTAELAIRNLNGFELNGRQLRVDSAAGNAGREMGASAENAEPAVPVVEESPYGAEPEPGKAPEAISRSVASLAPEKMFALMQQMKEVVRSNSMEAKNMLMSNPQLAYALLQAQVVMRIVDPQVAIAMLHRETPHNHAPFHQQAGMGNMLPPASSLPPPVSHQQPPIAVPVSAMQPPQFAPPPAMPGMNIGGPVHHRPPVSGYGAPPVSSGYPHHMPPPVVSAAPAPAAAAAAPADLSADEAQNAQLLVQVLQLREEEIAMLPPGDREKVIELRNQLRNTVQ